MKKSLTCSMLAMLLFLSSLPAKSQSPSVGSVISETINFLLNKNFPSGYIRSAMIEFSVFESAGGLGIISGKIESIKVDSVIINIGTTNMKKYFLSGGVANWINTGIAALQKSASFTSSKSAVLSTPPAYMELKSSVKNITFNLPNTLAAVKTTASYSVGNQPANQYVLSGFIDPAQPNLFVAIRITQQFVSIGG